MKYLLKKFCIEILIVLIFTYVILDKTVFKSLESTTIYPIAFAAISLLLVSTRTRVLVEEYKEKVRGRVFAEYHKLIRVMNGVEDHFNDDDKTPAREVQCAAIFELRHYPEYKYFTYRTLKRWRERETEKRESDINKQVDELIEGMKKDGHQIREDYKEILNPLLTEIKSRKTLRYEEEIKSTLKALGYLENTK